MDSVSALACSLVKLFSNMDPEARIGFFVGAKSPSSHAVRLADRTVDVDIINHRMSPRARLSEHAFAPAGHVESDNEASQHVLDSLAPRFPGRVYMVSREYDQSEIKSVIGMCDFFIGSRMHACIAAISQGVPAVGVAYSRKFKGVFDSVGVGEVVVDARTTSTDDAVTRIMKTFTERVALRSTLSSRLSELRALLFEVFRGLTVSPAPLHGSREETQPDSAASM